jgi:hypothetical protein
VLRLQQAMGEAAGETTAPPDAPRDTPPDASSEASAPAKNKITVEKMPEAGRDLPPISRFPRCPMPSVAAALTKIPGDITPGWFAARAGELGVKPDDFHGPWQIVNGSASLQGNLDRSGYPTGNLRVLAAVTDLPVENLMKEWKANSPERPKTEVAEPAAPAKISAQKVKKSDRSP